MTKELSARSSTPSGRRHITPRSVETESVDTDELSNGRSCRIGDTVYYDASDSGPYIDGEDAFADVPEGGTLLLASGTYHVPEEGPLHASVPKTITGLGWSSQGGSVNGSIIENTSFSHTPVDTPLIQFQGTSTTIIEGATVRNLGMVHHGTSYAVHIDYAPKSLIEDCYIAPYNSGLGGVRYSNESFFGRQNRTHIYQADESCVLIDSTALGEAYEFNQCHFNTARDGATALTSHRPGVTVRGGQLSATGTNGIGFLDLSGDSWVYDTLFESTPTAIQYGDATNDSEGGGSTNITAHDCGTAVHYRNGRNHTTIYPYLRSGTTNAAEWSADSQRDLLVAQMNLSGQAGYVVDSSALIPAVVIPRVLRGSEVGNLTTDPNLHIWVAYDATEGSPVLHNGTDWLSADFTAYTP